MGLDIWVKKATRVRVNKYQPKFEELNKLIKHEYNKEDCDFDKIDVWEKELNEIDPWEDIAYFRKVNFLLPFFGYEDNCTDLEIDKCQIEDLIDACKQVLADNSKAEELLPTEPGFFFGGLQYDDYYFQDVKDVLDKFTEMLKNKRRTDVFVMHCWW